MQQTSYRRWITLAIISFSGGVGFDLAYLRYIYQIPMAKFMGFSNTDRLNNEHIRYCRHYSLRTQQGIYCR